MVPAISVIIPHLNQADALRRCLASLAAQQEAPAFETIVVDNGSAVLPERLCAAHGARLFAEPTPGPGPARNRGASAARAPVLAFVDADCIAGPGWLAAIAARFSDPAETRVLGGDVRIACENPVRLGLIEAYESVYAYRMEQYIRRESYTGTGNLAVRAEVFAKVGPFGGIGMAEDMDWGQRASRLGHPPVFVPEMRVFHPARRTFAELARKWDRHIAHVHAETRRKPLGRLRWIAWTGAVAISPAFELLRILRSDRIAGPRARSLAFLGMTRMRLYRARRMIGLALGADPAKLVDAWNRDGTGSS